MRITEIFALGGDCGYGDYGKGHNGYGKGYGHGGYGKGYHYGYSNYYHGYHHKYYYRRGLLGIL